MADIIAVFKSDLLHLRPKHSTSSAGLYPPHPILCTLVIRECVVGVAFVAADSLELIGKYAVERSASRFRAEIRELLEHQSVM